jgi:MinD-like ATPase involved in chromosome partitioning or flagellar assembly
MSGVVVMGAAGGCGATTLAVALALTAVQPGQAPLLVDAGLHGSGPGALWAMAPSRALDDLLPVGEHLTGAHVDHLVHRHACGVDVVAGSTGPATALALSGAATAAVAGHVAGRAAWVADAGMGDGPLARALVPHASRVVMVVPATVQGARRAVGLLQALPPVATVVASALPGGDRLSGRALRAALGGRDVLALDRDDRAALDVADARAPRGRRLARVVAALMEEA